MIGSNVKVVIMRKILFYLLLAIICTSCTSSTELLEPVCDEIIDIKVETTSIEIFSVVNAQTFEDIPEVTLSNFQFNGESVNPNEIFSLDKEIFSDIFEGLNGITFLEDALLCVSGCKFGHAAQEGTYSFDVSATGFKTQREEVVLKYETFVSSCYRSELALELLFIRLEVEENSE